MECKDNPLKDKSYAFSLRMIRLYRYLSAKKHERVLAKQVLRSGTSIGANVCEANGAHSSPDFVAKLQIAYKESLETEYWLMLLRDSGYIAANPAESILTDCRELEKLLCAIISSTKKRSRLTD